MLNYIWAFMILASIVVGFFNGNLNAVVQSAFDSANGSIQTVLSIVGVTALWSGMMKIAEKSGLIKIFTKMIKPINSFIFPELKGEKTALEAVSANMVANFLGLSNAATPLGIKAMEELDRINGRKAKASNSMCMFAIINSASIQLLPSTMIGIRTSFLSANPSEIIVPVWIVSFVTAFSGICLAKFFEKRG